MDFTGIIHVCVRNRYTYLYLSILMAIFLCVVELNYIFFLVDFLLRLIIFCLLGETLRTRVASPLSCDLHRTRHKNAKKISDQQCEKMLYTYRMKTVCIIFSLLLTSVSVSVSCKEFAVTPMESPLHGMPVAVDTLIPTVLNPTRKS